VREISGNELFRKQRSNHDITEQMAKAHTMCYVT